MQVETDALKSYLCISPGRLLRERCPLRIINSCSRICRRNGGSGVKSGRSFMRLMSGLQINGAFRAEEFGGPCSGDPVALFFLAICADCCPQRYPNNKGLTEIGKSLF